MPNRRDQTYPSSSALLTDFYQLTMAYGYWKTNLHEQEASFYYSFRNAPFAGGYAIFAGLQPLMDYIVSFQFTTDDIDFLASLQTGQRKALFPKEFLYYLKGLRFSCDIDAVEEGTVVFPHEPLVRVIGPVLQCQLLESSLLNHLNFQTLIATKASRVCYAAGNDPVLEFGLRRAQGVDGALSASRAAYIGGCVATSNVLAGKLYDIPLQGTHAHSWVLCFPSELEAFKVYGQTLPEGCIFLADTYNTLEGVKNAITLAQALKAEGFCMAGVRLDSGDLAYLSIETRKLLDAAGFVDAMIVGSNNLNEQLISSLKQQGAMITHWGVGTELVTAYQQPALDGVYKLSALRQTGGEWHYKLKLSEQPSKISTPGLLRLRRFYHTDQKAFADAVYDARLGMASDSWIIDPLDATHRCKFPVDTTAVELMQPIFRAGRLVYQSPTLRLIQQKTRQALSQFRDSIRRFLNPQRYLVGLEENLYNLKTDMILQARALGTVE